MAITITDKLLAPYEIEVDGSNFTLTLKSKIATGENAGKNKIETMGYYTSLDGCLSRVVKSKMVEKDRKVTLQQFIEEYKEWQKAILAVLKKAGIQ